MGAWFHEPKPVGRWAPRSQARWPLNDWVPKDPRAQGPRGPVDPKACRLVGPRTQGRVGQGPLKSLRAQGTKGPIALWVIGSMGRRFDAPN